LTSSVGVDLKGVAVFMGLDLGSLGSTAGTFAIAYLIHKATAPIRLGITIFLTPYVVKMWNRLSIFSRNQRK
jgi:hypothetical protein